MRRTFFKDIKSAYNNFYLHRGFLLTAASSFYLMLCLIPLIIIVSGLVGLFTNTEVVTLFLSNVIQRMFGPSIYNLTSYLISLAQSSSLAMNSITSIVLLFIATNAFLNASRESLEIIWGKKEKTNSIARKIVKEIARIIRNATIILVSAALIVLFVALMVIASFIRVTLSSLLGYSSVLINILAYVLIIFLLAIFIAYIFFISSSGTLSKKVLIKGSLLTAIFVLAGQAIIGVYFSYFITDYDLALGPLTVLIWIYYSIAVFIYGAELTHIYSTKEKERSKNGRR